MSLQAFKLQINLDFSAFNPGHPQLPAAVEKGRNEARANIIKRFGGDPLDWQATPMRVGEKEVIMLWRLPSQSAPLEDVRKTVRRWIFLLPDGLFPIVDWQLLYHVCGNGNRKSCGAWQVLDEGVGIPLPSSFSGGA